MNSLLFVLPDANSGRLRWCACLFVAVLSLCYPPALQAQNAAAFTYTTHQNAITITGGCPDSPGALVIPETINGLPVTGIGDGAFWGCWSLTSVVIPDSVTRIGERAFAGCGGLTSVAILNGTASIGHWAFEDCQSLNDVKVGSGAMLLGREPCPDGVLVIQATIQGLPVTHLGPGVFSGCTGLTSVVIPESVTWIGGSAFSGCLSLTNVVIPNSVTSIGASAFWGCDNLNYVKVGSGAMLLRRGPCPDGVLAIQPTIQGLPVTHLGPGVFSDCKGLTSVVIPESVTWIGHSAFSRCWSLTSVAIPDSVTSIGDGAFAATGLTNVVIPNSVTSIGDRAFFDCWSLANVVIPNTVTRIGEGAFSGCTSLTNVEIPNRVTRIGKWAFSSCGSLTNVVIPNSVTSIGEVAFSGCWSLTSVTIGNGVTHIGVGAFSGSTSLTRIHFQGNAPSFDSSALNDVNKVTIYYLPGTSGWSSTFAGRPTALWTLPEPVILTSPPGVALQTNGFGFRISWATHSPVVVEATTSLTAPEWSPVSTNALVDGWVDFRDPSWADHGQRFYRVRGP